MSVPSYAQRLHLWTPLVGIVVLLIVDTVVGGENSDNAQLEMEEIVVKGDPRNIPMRSDHGSLTVIDNKHLELVRPHHPHEIFARTPGVWIVKNSGQEHLTGIRSAVLAGAGACGSYLLLEDNIPIRPTGFCNVNGLFELNIEQADRIEILRGPASAMFGGNALRGVINVRPFGGGNTPRVVSLETGVHDYRQIRVAWQSKNVHTKLHATDTKGFRDETGYEQQKFNIAWTTNIGTWEANHALSMTFLEQETGGYVQGYKSYADKKLRRTNPNPEAYRDAASLRIHSQLSNGNNFYIYPYIRLSQMNFLQHFLPGQPREDNEQISAGFVLLGSTSLPALTIDLGAQLDWMRASLVQEQRNPTMGSAFLRATRPVGTHFDFAVAGTTFAIFESATVTWRVRHEIEQSFRLEHTQYQYDNHHLDGNTRDDGTHCAFGGCLYTRPSDGTDQYTNFAARIGYKFQSTDNSYFWVLASLGYRPPQITELYRLQSGQSVADLKSEQLHSVEFGWQTSWHTIDLAIATYFDSSSNLIFRDADGMNVSNGATVAQGIEIELQWEVNDVHTLILASSVANHEYDFTRDIARGESIVAGNQVDTAPQVLAHARWLVAFGTAGKGEIEINRIGPHFVDAANTARYRGHNVVNFRMEIQLHSRWALFGRILNVLDAYYADRADFAFGAYRYFPADVRQFFVGIKRDF